MWHYKPEVGRNYVIDRSTVRDHRVVASLDGIHWSKAPRPPKRHRCWPQTRLVGRGKVIYRCPCGGWTISPRAKRWVGRNSRKTRLMQWLTDRFG